MATTKKMFSKSLIRSNRFQSLSSDTVRLFYILTQLDLDNIGRTQGNKFYLKGKLYELRDDVSCEDCGEMLRECEGKDLFIVYECNGRRYIQDPFHLEHNKITGNMSDNSLYPPPPKEVVESWEQRTGEVYTLYVHGIDGVKLNHPKVKDKTKVKEEVKEEVKESGFKSKFDEAWGMYPKKEGKKQAEKSYKATVKTQQDHNRLLKAISNYKKSDRATSGIYVKNGSTFFNDWEDWVEATPEMMGKTTKHSGPTRPENKQL